MPSSASDSVTLCLGGDVMTGRGIDQVLPCPGAPQLHESYVRDARDYVTLAERRNGPIPRPVDFAYPWGDALEIVERHRPDAFIVNLETSITTSERFEPDKGIHYRMHPDNVPCLTALGADGWVLANNHVLDWGRDGLLDTLDALDSVPLASAGAGRDLEAAARPLVLNVSAAQRVLVYACGMPSSGIPSDWAAGATHPGVHLLEHDRSSGVDALIERIAVERRSGDTVVLSVHWGGNWGYAVPTSHRALAHRLIDAGVADVVHGHSSHHPMPIELYRGRPIIYGCGDLLNDYEGIGGYEAFRADLAFLYCLELDPASGALRAMRLAPLQIERMRLQRCRHDDVRWLAARLAEQCPASSVEIDEHRELRLTLR